MLDAATLKDFDTILAETCGKKEGEARDAGLVLLASAHVGGDTAKVAEALGWDVPRVEPFAERIKANGIWTADGRVAADWDDEQDGGLAFACDVNVALGLMKRA
jgi:hypothetical protein